MNLVRCIISVLLFTSSIVIELESDIGSTCPLVNGDANLNKLLKYIANIYT